MTAAGGTARVPGRLEGARQAKLRALVRATWPTEDPSRAGTMAGGALVATGDGSRGWALLDDGEVAGFGAALVWARRRGAGHLDVLVEDRQLRPAPSGVVARRAGAFAHPPQVWVVSDRSIEPAVPGGVATVPPGVAAVPPGVAAVPPGVATVPPGVAAVPPGVATVPPGVAAVPPGGGGATGVAALPAGVAADMTRLIVAHGALPVTEVGILRAEVLGLEVARAVGDDKGGWTLQVGVGRHDRDARQQLHPGQDPGDALDAVVGLVGRLRVVDARRHPANTLARERWLRAALVADPGLVGATALRPVPSPTRPDDLRLPSPAAAVGTDGDGREVVVVVSTGVDVDLVPTAADIRLHHAPRAHLVLALPATDCYPVTRELAAALDAPAEVRPVIPVWASAPA